MIRAESEIRNLLEALGTMREVVKPDNQDLYTGARVALLWAVGDVPDLALLRRQNENPKND